MTRVPTEARAGHSYEESGSQPSGVGRTAVIVKAEASFYAALQECPRDLLAAAPGLHVERRDLGTYLTLSDGVLAAGSLFGRYLEHHKARRVFGARHPLYGRAAVTYDDSGQPIGLSGFCTRLLLAYMEVQLGLGFTGAALRQQRLALEAGLAGEREELHYSYYYPFAHRDNVGLHYVYGPDEQGSGYPSPEWGRFLWYVEEVMKSPFRISPGDVGGTEQGLQRALDQLPRQFAEPHHRDGSVPIFVVRHWARVVEGVLAAHPDAARQLVTDPETGEELPYIPLMDCLLDLPYRNRAVVVFQSTCGSR